MAGLLKDSVVENSNSPGVGTVQLAGAIGGPFVTFATRFSSGDKVFYGISDEASQREIGIGTFTAGTPNTLARDVVKSNTSGTTSKLNFTGLVYVYCTLPGDNALYIDDTGAVSITGNITATGTVAAHTVTGSANITATGTVSGAHLSATTDITTPGSITATGNIHSTATVSAGAGSFGGGATPATLTASFLTVTDNIRIANLTTGTGSYDQFEQGGGAVGGISFNGSNVVYATTSDQSLKNDLGLINNSGTLIDKLMPRWFTWKNRPDVAPQPQPGFFAQEVYNVYPWVVVEGAGKFGDADFEPWQMDATQMMPLAIAEIKALRARLAVIEAKLGL